MRIEREATIAEIQRKTRWLQERGYDGLYLRFGRETCGCWVGDLRPCGYSNLGCVPAVNSPDGNGLVPRRLRAGVVR